MSLTNSFRNVGSAENNLVSLPELVFAEEEGYRAWVRTDPWKAIGLAHTRSDLVSACRSIACCSYPNPSIARGVLMSFLDRYATDSDTSLSSTLKECIVILAGWLLKNPLARDPAIPSHDVADRIGNLKWLMNLRRYSGVEREDCRWPTVFSGNDKVITEAIRQWPYLYWCDQLYQWHIAQDLTDFRDGFKRSKIVSADEVERLESVLRRICKVQDISFINLLREIQTMLTRHRAKSGSDDFAFGRAKSAVGTAIAVLQRRLRSNTGDASLLRLGRLLGQTHDCKVSVQVAPLGKVVRSIDDASPIEFRVTASASDSGKIPSVVEGLKVRVEIDGGYLTDTPYPFQLDHTRDFQSDGTVTFPIFACSGKHRVRMSIGKSVVADFYYEVLFK